MCPLKCVSIWYVYVCSTEVGVCSPLKLKVSFFKWIVSFLSGLGGHVCLTSENIPLMPEKDSVSYLRIYTCIIHTPIMEEEMGYVSFPNAALFEEGATCT